MIDAMVSALTAIFTWPTVAFIVIGTLIGMVFGALPGLGGVVALALLIPITFGMDALPAMVLFGSTLGGVAFGGSISAILINTPGTAPNAATCFDGYPLARQGRASEALGVSATASALGAIFGLMILVLILPMAREFILAFGPPEFFALAIFGLTIIAVASEANLLRGLIAGGFGLMLAFIGYNSVTGVYRYGFGTQYLWDGVKLIPALIGIFAIAEVIHLTVRGGTIAEDDEANLEDRSAVLTGVKAVLRRPSVFIRSAATGTLIGIVPGAGGTVANFISYMQVMQTSSDPGSFGTGNIDGIIASEAANDSKDGGALLPTVIFGIPGSSAMAVLLGGLILHGLNPGRELVTTNLNLLFILIFALLLSNILTSIIGIGVANQLAKLTRIRAPLIVPGILVISLVGSFALNNSLGDVLLAVVFGIIGYAMIEFDYSRVAIVIALVLGPLAESSLHQSLLISEFQPNYLIFFSRPITILLFSLTIFSLLLPFIRRRIRSDNSATGDSL
jgi:putative tricarboxylic transport membrane protein